MAEKEKSHSAALEPSVFVDEALESIWELGERLDKVTLRDVIGTMGNEERIVQMQTDGLVTISDEGIAFTPSGRKRARDITRRHRLAERLFYDVLDLEEFEEDACRLEHAISPGVEAAICTFLGHPPFCPHGKPIPKGECCKLYTRKLQPLVKSLKHLEVGAEANVVFITTPAMDRLSSIGLIPGTRIRLHQRKPSYVVEIDETTIAIDEDIAEGIFVK